MSFSMIKILKFKIKALGSIMREEYLRRPENLFVIHKKIIF